MTQNPKKEKTFKRRDLILILCLVLLAAAALIIIRAANAGKKAKNEIAVYVDGQPYLTAPLKPGEDLTVAQENGCVNVIHMVEGGFFMQSSTCKNQDCVHQGSVTRDNWQTRLLGTHVICLPNLVGGTLLVEDAGGAPDV